MKDKSKSEIIEPKNNKSPRDSVKGIDAESRGAFSEPSDRVMSVRPATPFPVAQDKRETKPKNDTDK